MNVDLWIDGSYNILTNTVGAGFVMYCKDFDIDLDGSTHSEDVYNAKNVYGEILAVKSSINFLLQITSKYKYLYPLNVTIYYDYSGLEKWVTGEWKAKTNLTKEYRDFILPISSIMNLTFVKVKSHSGSLFNDRADILAKKACGLL